MKCDRVLNSVQENGPNRIKLKFDSYFTYFHLCFFLWVFVENLVNTCYLIEIGTIFLKMFVKKFSFRLVNIRQQVLTNFQRPNHQHEYSICEIPPTNFWQETQCMDLKLNWAIGLKNKVKRKWIRPEKCFNWHHFVASTMIFWFLSVKNKNL